MCKRRNSRPEPGVEHPYDGATMNLRVGHSPYRWGGFPWWMLWLIWPLIWLFKGLGAFFGTLAAGASPAMLLFAVVLITAGVALLIADRTSR